MSEPGEPEVDPTVPPADSFAEYNPPDDANADTPEPEDAAAALIAGSAQHLLATSLCL